MTSVDNRDFIELEQSRYLGGQGHPWRTGRGFENFDRFPGLERGREPRDSP